MPAAGIALAPREHILTFDEIERLAKLFVSRGVTKIRLTGGEPLVRKNVEDLVDRLGSLKGCGLETLAIITNGLLLSRKLDRLQSAGLDLINISLDTLRPDRFEVMTRRPGFDRVMGAIEHAIVRGYDPVKVNCVVMRDINDDELLDFVSWTKDWPIAVRFIEFMPFKGNGWKDTCLVSYQEMRDRIETRFELERMPNGPHDTSKTFRVPGHRGTVGFISSMTTPFCSGCNRLRLAADGNLKVCLFGSTEISLRDAIRAGATNSDLLNLISTTVAAKNARHAGMKTLAMRSNRPMTTIGG
jgi:cyclic pyranopterin phosphate synthase